MLTTRKTRGSQDRILLQWGLSESAAKAAGSGVGEAALHSGTGVPMRGDKGADEQSLAFLGVQSGDRARPNAGEPRCSIEVPWY